MVVLKQNITVNNRISQFRGIVVGNKNKIQCNSIGLIFPDNSRKLYHKPISKTHI